METKEARRIMRIKVSKVLEVFNMYGFHVYLPQANKVLADIAEEFHKNMQKCKIHSNTPERKVINESKDSHNINQ